jgi:hypothetical protein
MRTSGVQMGSSIMDVSGSAPSYLNRAWVNFNGTGTVAIRADENVSTITDSGTGTYRVNFSTAMNITHFATDAMCNQGGNTGWKYGCSFQGNGVNQTTSGVTIQTRRAGDHVLQDCSVVTVNVVC